MDRTKPEGALGLSTQPEAQEGEGPSGNEKTIALSRSVTTVDMQRVLRSVLRCDPIRLNSFGGGVVSTDVSASRLNLICLRGLAQSSRAEVGRCCCSRFFGILDLIVTTAFSFSASSSRNLLCLVSLMERPAEDMVAGEAVVVG